MTNDLGLTYDEITRHVRSSSADCEGVFAGRVNGFGRIWREKIRQPLLHTPGRQRPQTGNHAR